MLSVPVALLALLEDEAPLIAPPWVFAAIAAAFFLVLGLITWSFRDVANRHSEKTRHSSTSDHH